MTETAVKYFTVDEANADFQGWRDGIYRYEVLAAASRSEDGETDEQVALRDEVDEVAQRINGFISELSAVGCVFKGFEGGLVDFHSQLDGRNVFLCWKLGEPEVAHWHEVDAGFAGRKPLAGVSVTGESN